MEVYFLKTFKTNQRHQCNVPFLIDLYMRFTIRIQAGFDFLFFQIIFYIHIQEILKWTAVDICFYV